MRYRRTGPVVCTWETRDAYKLWLEHLKEETILETRVDAIVNLFVAY
jgi:hypothetical protein